MRSALFVCRTMNSAASLSAIPICPLFQSLVPILKKTVRSAGVIVAVLFIGLSLAGIFGVWLVERRATEIARKGFGFVESAVGVVDAGVGRVNELIATSRTEVRQAAETITATGARAEANSPVLSALNERLE